MKYLLIDLYSGETRALTEDEFKELVEGTILVRNEQLLISNYVSEEYMIIDNEVVEYDE